MRPYENPLRSRIRHAAAAQRSRDRRGARSLWMAVRTTWGVEPRVVRGGRG